jgi:2-polyprenyl-6-methoxyphenol hydroxylase-like FAD-dependent oxidoreductase
MRCTCCQNAVRRRAALHVAGAARDQGSRCRSRTLSQRYRFNSFPLATNDVVLAKWELLDELAATRCPPIHRVTVDYGPLAVSGRPGAVDGTAIMFSPRRTVLDQLLVAAARRAGAEMREAVTFRGLLYDGNRVVGAQLEDKNGDASECSATIVVGADGIWSTVARAANAATEGPHLSCPSACVFRGLSPPDCTASMTSAS